MSREYVNGEYKLMTVEELKQAKEAGEKMLLIENGIE